MTRLLAAFLLVSVGAACGRLHIDELRTKTNHAVITQLASAVEFFAIDNGRYPTTEEGLEALTQAPADLKATYQPGGYWMGRAIPLDPWGRPYRYQSPPRRNAKSFDLWSLGADGVPGGEGVDADVGNWPGGFPSPSLSDRIASAVTGAVMGFTLGAPFYAVGVLVAMRRERQWLRALRGGHLTTLGVLIGMGAAAVFLLGCSAIA